jgi:pimeloyl-ACP methyl ester carboxylesterase
MERPDLRGGPVMPLARGMLRIPMPPQAGLGSGLEMVGWVCGPPPGAGRPHALVYCVPGGGCTAEGYFDLHVDGLPGYSMAEEFARAGFIVLGFDHLGTGGSSPVCDPFLLTPERLADHAAFVLRDCLERLERGRLLGALLPPVGQIPVIGIGHSMGAMVAVVQQARHRSYDMLVNLGHAGDEWAMEYLPAECRGLAPRELRASAVPIARTWHARRDDGVTRAQSNTRLIFNAADVPRQVRVEVRRRATLILPTAGFVSMTPYAVAVEKGDLDIPLFLGFGEFDHSRKPHQIVSQYGRARLICLHVVEGSGHNHNQSSGRLRLWSSIVSWIRQRPTP